MPRKPRNTEITSFFHVMIQGINKSYIFERENEINYFINTVYKIKDEHDIKIIAYCIMNNHAHMLLKVKNISQLSKFMQSLNTRYARYYNKQHNRVGYVFRDRYRCEGIYTQKHLYNCINYIYNNPVKAGICIKPEEYKYSNYKDNNYQLKEEDLNYKFIDIEEDKKDIKQIINDYVGDENINQILNDKERIRKFIRYLKNDKSISFRKMEVELGMSRETLRRLLK